MVRLNIVLSEDLKQQLEARASESGHASVEDYVTTLILADANGASADYGAPAGQVVHTQAQLEQMLLEGLASPAGDMRAADWEELRRKVAARRGL